MWQPPCQMPPASLPLATSAWTRGLATAEERAACYPPCSRVGSGPRAKMRSTCTWAHRRPAWWTGLWAAGPRLRLKLGRPISSSAHGVDVAHSNGTGGLHQSLRLGEACIVAQVHPSGRRATAIGFGLLARSATRVHDVASSIDGGAWIRFEPSWATLWMFGRSDALSVGVAGLYRSRAYPLGGAHIFSLGRRHVVLPCHSLRPRAHDLRYISCCGSGRRARQSLGEMFGCVYRAAPTPRQRRADRRRCVSLPSTNDTGHGRNILAPLGSNVADGPPIQWRARKGPEKVLGRLSAAKQFLARESTCLRKDAHVAHVRLPDLESVRIQPLLKQTGVGRGTRNATPHELSGLNFSTRTCDVQPDGAACCTKGQRFPVGTLHS